ncbi:hypothetical protein MSG28_010177 [Choristoneura fumiferana]|uniref:Uncharacterized protein n=1 Tax=Choristoneura fumiferana TaxID=7141 RepID=A0ACC0KJZ0_CHOFU|nr:hypothetical protein MSG28_010177 [Choristoneura fumiferana]
MERVVKHQNSSIMNVSASGKTIFRKRRVVDKRWAALRPAWAIYKEARRLPRHNASDHRRGRSHHRTQLTLRFNRQDFINLIKHVNEGVSLRQKQKRVDVFNHLTQTLKVQIMMRKHGLLQGFIELDKKLVPETDLGLQNQHFLLSCGR